MRFPDQEPAPSAEQAAAEAEVVEEAEAIAAEAADIDAMKRTMALEAEKVRIRMCAAEVLRRQRLA